METPEYQTDLDNPDLTAADDPQGTLLFAVENVVVNDVDLETPVERRSAPWLEDDDVWPALAEADTPALDAEDVTSTDATAAAQAGGPGANVLFGRQSDDGALDAEVVAELEAGHILESESVLKAEPDPDPDPSSLASDGADDDGEPTVGPGSCRVCTSSVSRININVDGNDLILESCDHCDARRWRLDGQSIDLQQALDEVGEHVGRK